LKSYSNKNSKKYNETLNDLINAYSKKGTDIKNIYKLPSGLKGIIYYKVNEIKHKNLDIHINISRQLSNVLTNLDSKTYAIVCKIVGITFDNAIEASENSNKKTINFDVYEEETEIIIELTNSYKGKIDISKISNKNYSTKGKGRGLGLYIVKSLIKSNSNIVVNQDKTDLLFTTEIHIKKPR
jgi:two-component system sensor histidine kinase AgrC